MSRVLYAHLLVPRSLLIILHPSLLLFNKYLFSIYYVTGFWFNPGIIYYNLETVSYLPDVRKQSSHVVHQVLSNNQLEIGGWRRWPYALIILSTVLPLLFTEALYGTHMTFKWGLYVILYVQGCTDFQMALVTIRRNKEICSPVGF